MNGSFWIDAPRTHFAALCISRFGVGFDAPGFFVSSDRVSDRPVKPQTRAAGTPIREEFENQYEATNRASELESAGVIENPEVKSEEVEIPF